MSMQALQAWETFQFLVPESPWLSGSSLVDDKNGLQTQCPLQKLRFFTWLDCGELNLTLKLELSFEKGCKDIIRNAHGIWFQAMRDFRF